MPMDEGYDQYFSSAVNTAKKAKKRRVAKKAAAKKAAVKKVASTKNTVSKKSGTWAGGVRLYAAPKKGTGSAPNISATRRGQNANHSIRGAAQVIRRNDKADAAKRRISGTTRSRGMY